MMKRILFILLGVVCCANLAFAQIADKNLGEDRFFLWPKISNTVDPKKIIVELKPGQTDTEEFILGNASPYQRTFKLYVTDFYLNAQGDADYKNENEERKLQKWIKLDNEEVTLKPKEEKPIKITFQPPVGLPLDDYQAGVAGVFTSPSKNNPNLKIAVRYVMDMEVKVTDNPKHVPIFGEANIFAAQVYLPVSIILFAGCMAYFYHGKKKEKQTSGSQKNEDSEV